MQQTEETPCNTGDRARDLVRKLEKLYPDSGQREHHSTGRPTIASLHARPAIPASLDYALELARELIREMKVQARAVAMAELDRCGCQENTDSLLTIAALDSILDSSIADAVTEAGAMSVGAADRTGYQDDSPERIATTMRRCRSNLMMATMEGISALKEAINKYVHQAGYRISLSRNESRNPGDQWDHGGTQGAAAVHSTNSVFDPALSALWQEYRKLEKELSPYA